MGGGAKTSTKVKLSPQARKVASNELGLLMDYLGPRQESLQRDVVRGQRGDVRDTGAGRGLEQALSVVPGAVEGAGAGLSPGDLSGVLDSLQIGQGGNMAGLAQLFDQLGMSSQSIVDPRFAQFLKPQIDTETKPGAGQQAATYGSMAIAAASIAVAIAI